ncbi:MAG: hypothetical protein JNJ69_09300 [Leptospiraceae bacterium]|nr:hypothetical protein [Leptospiraceae bacterium]
MTESTFIDKSVSRLVAQKPVRYHINALTKSGRKQLMTVLTGFFKSENLNHEHAFAIHYAIVEIVFNALKANLKFVAFREEIRKQLHRFKIYEIEDLLQVIIEERTLREFMATRVVPELLRNQVRQIFDLEEKYRAGMAAKLSAEQVELLKKFRLLVRSIDANVTLEITHTPQEIRISVTNKVPMLARDLERIEHSRKRHRELHNEGRSGDFFSYENMDTTESAGFGIAMVDQGLYRLGLDPFEQLKIQSKNRETIVDLIYPRRVLVSQAQ